MYGSVLDVKPLDHYTSKTRSWYYLLPVLLGILLLVQAGSAKLQVNVQVSPDTISLGNSAVISVDVSDPDYPNVRFSGSPVKVYVFQESSGTNISAMNTQTNASGWFTHSFTPPETGKYRINAETTVNYNNIPGLPDIGVKHAVSEGNVYLRVNEAPHFIPHVTTHVIVPLITATTTTTATTAQPVTTTLTAQQTTPVTQVAQTTAVTQATQAPQATSTVPGSQTDTTPPVTTLTLAGTEDGSGGYSSDVICTLTAADNAGGSGVKVTQYSFDSTSWNTYSQPFSIVKAGSTTLYYRSADNAGNTEVAKVKAVVISGPGAAPVSTTVPAATSTATGSGSSLPLWLIGLVIVILLAAIGGGLYLKSRQGREEQKK